MITDDKFFDIFQKHILAVINEVNQNGTASAIQWTNQLANVVVSTLMTVSDEMVSKDPSIPQKHFMDVLVSQVRILINEQKDWHLSNVGKELE